MSKSFAVSAIKSSNLKNIVARNYATQVSTAVKQNNVSLAELHPEISTLNNGTLVISVENYEPISNVAIFVRSGARYESYATNRGISHMVRLCAGLRTRDFTAFSLTRTTEFMGADLGCETGREHIRYDMNMNRDLLKEGFSMLSNIAAFPKFNDFEVNATPLFNVENIECQSFHDRIKADLAAIDPTAVTMDLLHKAAFRRSPLGNSLRMPASSVGTYTSEELLKFHRGTHTSDRIAIVGLGVRHHDLVTRAKKLDLQPGDGLSSEKSKYMGSEIHHDVKNKLSYIAVAGPGASFGSEHAASLAIAQSILGTSSGLKHGSNSTNKLQAALRSAGGIGNVSTFNINYSDAGLFGFFIVEEGSKANEVAKAVAKHIKNLKVSETDVKQAVVRAKSAYYMGLESSPKLIENLGMQAILTRNIIAPSEHVAALDKVTASSVQDALQIMVKAKPSLVVYGNQVNAPYADEL